MKIKEQSIKYKGSFPHKKFTTSIKGLKMVTEIFEDGGGYYTCENKYDQYYAREDAKINDWIEELENELEKKAKILKLTIDFLKRVKEKVDKVETQK